MAKLGRFSGDIEVSGTVERSSSRRKPGSLASQSSDAPEGQRSGVEPVTTQ
jgi:hypothetical protein